MNKRKLTKAVINNLTNFGLGSAATGIVRNNITPSQHKGVQILINISVLVTGWAISDTVAEPIHANTNKKIDALFDQFEGVTVITDK